MLKNICRHKKNHEIFSQHAKSLEKESAHEILVPITKASGKSSDKPSQEEGSEQILDP